MGRKGRKVKVQEGRDGGNKWREERVQMGMRAERKRGQEIGKEGWMYRRSEEGNGGEKAETGRGQEEGRMANC